MIAMILAAGRGKRLRPLTDRQPKPLLPAGGKPLIVHILEQLKTAGFNDIIINTAWLGKQLSDTLGTGRQWNLNIRYSHEQTRFGYSLETAGGIRAMIPSDNPAPFLVINGDIVCDFDLSQSFCIAKQMKKENHLAHLVLVANPKHHPQGDFIWHNGRIFATAEKAPLDAQRLTFSGIGIYDPQLFADLPLGQPVRLLEVLQPAILKGKVDAQRHDGVWIDAGTPDRLKKADLYYGEKYS